MSSSRTPDQQWTADDIPDLTGKQYLVTGVTSGLGEQTSIALAQRGAAVILAARSETKLTATTAAIAEQVPGAQLHPLIVDLADLSSVRRAADEAQAFGALDCLVNNAGVMATPQRRTVDGFDLQMGTNHFGAFALTGLLLPLLEKSGDGRVVAVSSNAHKMARTSPLKDPRESPKRYSRWGTYAQSKLANLLFTYELDRRLRDKEMPVRALAAHPGYSSTRLLGNGRNVGGGNPFASLFHLGMKIGAQPATVGALPTLMAATADLPGSTYVGPSNLGETRGLPRIVGSTRLARDQDAQRRLWELSEEATGVRYP